MDQSTSSVASYSTGRPLSRADYNVACICPMGVELAPVEAMLDETHPSIATERDQNAYTLGSIGGHNVVIAAMPQIGHSAATTVATQLLNDFPALRFNFLVGIGGGIPGHDGKDDIRLGDIVVSQPSGTSGGVLQYDMGKITVDGVFERTGATGKPPATLSAHVERLKAQHRREGSRVSYFLSQMLKRFPRMANEYAYPGVAHDQLFHAEYAHQRGLTCDLCDRSQCIPRRERVDANPKVHYGVIGSANAVVKDALTRDRLQREFKLICVEMEAAGLSDTFPCLIIRGICDYADSHKNKQWQPYAAAVAAAYFKELLMTIPARILSQESILAPAISRPDFELGLNLFDAPDIGSDLFVGRKSDITEMSSILLSNLASTERQTLVLGGIGGIGKTQLAINYAKLHRTSYTSTFWLNATSLASLKASLRLVVQYVMSADEQRSYDDHQIQVHFARWLSQKHNTKWLLIYDNYDEPDQFDLRQYFPYASHGTIIVTTRLPDQVLGTKFKIRPLIEVGESLQILEKRSGRRNLQLDPDAHRLAIRLDGLPLALATVGAFLKHSPASYLDCLYEYDRRWNLTPRRRAILPDYPSRTLYTTWDLSYTLLQKEDPDAAQLLVLLAYFDHQNIWYDLLRAGIGTDTPQWLVDMAHTPHAFEDIMRSLVENCFLEASNSTKTYRMHICVHDWTVDALNRNPNPQYYWFAFDCVARSIGLDDLDGLSGLQYRQLTAHAIQLMHDRFDNVRNHDLSLHHKLNDARCIAVLLREQSEYKFAERLFYWTIAGCEAALGHDHLSTLLTIDNLALALFYQGKEQEAERMFKRALAGYERTVGLSHDSALPTITHLGILYRNQGKLEEAEQLYNQVLKTTPTGPNGDFESSLATMNNLGVLYHNQGKLAEAETMYRKVLDGYEQVMGTVPKPKTFRTMCNLADVTRDQRKFVEAEETYRKALAGYELVVGRYHAFTLYTAKALGELLDQGFHKGTAGTYDYDQWVSNLVNHLQKWGCHQRSLYGTLGRALLNDGDENNAQIAFVKQADIHDNEVIFCDGCALLITSATKRFVCMQCPDVDLCTTCLAKHYNGEPPVPSCDDHNFVRVRYEEFLNTENDMSPESSTHSSWLIGLANKYSGRLSSVPIKEGPTYKL